MQTHSDHHTRTPGSGGARPDGVRRAPVERSGDGQAAEILRLQRQAGNRAVTALLQGRARLSVQLKRRKKKAKAPSEADQLDAGFSGMTGHAGSDQLAALQPFAAQIEMLAAKGAITARLDTVIGGRDALVREGLKTAVLLSSLAADAVSDKVAALGLTGGPLGPDQRRAVDKLTADLTKSAKKGFGDAYKSLYARCLQAAAGLGDERGDDAWQAQAGETAAGATLRQAVKAVSKISAASFDVAYSERLLKARQDIVDADAAQGSKPIEAIVLGAGPVGMLAAIEAALAGASVHVYEMRRSGPGRENVLKLNEATYLKLRKVGVYAALFGPEHTKGDDTQAGSHAVSVAYLEDVLRTRAAQLGIKITYGYQLSDITAPAGSQTKTALKLIPYKPTRAGPEMDLWKKAASPDPADPKSAIDATSDLVIGATGGGASTGAKLKLGRGRKQDSGGTDLKDYVGVGLFEPDHQYTQFLPGVDKVEAGVSRWMVGLRTPKVDYLLAQVSEPNFRVFEQDKAKRDVYVAKRGKDAAKFAGQLKVSSVFDITLNQAQKFVNEQLGGVVIGDEAATPHPQTGSGFNTGAQSSGLVPGLVRGIAGGKRTEAFSAYDKGVKARTDAMIDKGVKYFQSQDYLRNAPKSATAMGGAQAASGASSPVPMGGPMPPTAAPMAPTAAPMAPMANTAAPTADDEPMKLGRAGYAVEDIGGGPGADAAYGRAQARTANAYAGRTGYDPEDIGVGPGDDEKYARAQARTANAYAGRIGYDADDIGVTPDKEQVYAQIQAKLLASFGEPKKVDPESEA